MTKKTGPTEKAAKANIPTTKRRPTKKITEKKQGSTLRTNADKIRISKKILELYIEGKHTLESCCTESGISHRTLLNWCESISEISTLLKKAKDQQTKIRNGGLKEIALNGLERLLLGYFVEETETVKVKRPNGTIVRIVETIRKKHVNASATAIIFALKNLDPENFNPERAGEDPGEEQYFEMGGKLIKF